MSRRDLYALFAGVLVGCVGLLFAVAVSLHASPEGTPAWWPTSQSGPEVPQP